MVYPPAVYQIFYYRRQRGNFGYQLFGFFKEVLYFTPLEAIIVNQFFLLAYVFFVNKHWSFKSTGLTHRQMVRFLTLSGVNYLISVTWMWFWNEKFGFNYLGVRIVNVALSVSWNLLYKYWVYKMPQISQKQTRKHPLLTKTNFYIRITP